MIALGAANYIVQTIFKTETDIWTHKQYFGNLKMALAFRAAIPKDFEVKIWEAKYQVMDISEADPAQLELPLE